MNPESKNEFITILQKNVAKESFDKFNEKFNKLNIEDKQKLINSIEKIESEKRMADNKSQLWKIFKIGGVVFLTVSISGFIGTVIIIFDYLGNW